MSTSDASAVLCGVPQGSVLGPLLFLLYTADLLRLVERHNLQPHMYADNTQMYGFCRPAAATQLQETVSACIDDVAAWMQSNRLLLNTTNTEVIWCALNRRQHQLPQVALRVGTHHVTPTTSVCDLGIYVDCDVSVRTHMSRSVSSCLAVLHQLRNIVSLCRQQYYSRWSSRLCCHIWTIATPRLPVYQETSSTDCSL